MSQAQFTLSKLFGPLFGADSWVLVGEVGLTHVHDMPDKDELLFQAPGTGLPGNPVYAATGLAPGTAPEDLFADATSWGYEMRARFDYLGAIGAVNLRPTLSFSHDVNGTTPAPIGNFVEDRKSWGLGLEATYLDSWSANVQYTNFFSGGVANLDQDNDFISLNVKYAF